MLRAMVGVPERAGSVAGEPGGGARPVLELRHLVKRYGRVEALSDLGLVVNEGEIYGFLGRNGAGKSTAIRVIMGITPATGGDVRLFGADGRADVIRLRQRIGYVAQEQNFYGWMTPEQLGRFLRGFYPTWDDAEYAGLIRRLELPPRRATQTFSGGMKVKLALALALAHRPELLVLDEPTAGLDPVARREFLELVRAQAGVGRRTTFFSTHLVDEVEGAAQRVGIVDAGRTLFEGTVAELGARVRRLRSTVPQSPPPAPGGGDWSAWLRVLRDEVRDGQRILAVEAIAPGAFEAFEAAAGPAGWVVEPLSLEEVFIEMVRRPWA
jgi:ABC-2 type transport system ATP-binding protein